jgi:hypothetical protein
MGTLATLLSEPPLRVVTKGILRRLPGALRAKARWDALERPEYLFSVLWAADRAKEVGIKAISAVEFGVAEGEGLLLLEAHAEAVQRLTGVRVHVYGFDSGVGLPSGTGDYRDHPDVWRAGDYRMDPTALRAKLRPMTTLILGDVRDEAASAEFPAPIGFVAFDLDFYSSTAGALRLLARPDVQRLRRVALYFDDVHSGDHYHRWAGELLAIDEFNHASRTVKIDRWRGVRVGRPFTDAPWLDGMYLAHDLDAINAAERTGPPRRMQA